MEDVLLEPVLTISSALAPDTSAEHLLAAQMDKLATGHTGQPPEPESSSPHRECAHASELNSTLADDACAELLLAVQMAKLGRAMATGHTGQPPEPESVAPAAPTEDVLMEAVPENGSAQANGDTKQGTWVQPQRFKTLVGRGHSEFSTGRQQVSESRARGGGSHDARRACSCMTHPSCRDTQPHSQGV